MIQVMSIAFQLAGALILLMWSIRGARKEAIIQRCFPGSNIADRDDDNNCRIAKEKIQKTAYEVFLNIFAFVDLIIGYLIAYFAVENYEPVCAVLYTVLATAAIIGFEMLVVYGFAKLRYNKDEIVPYEDLKEIGVDTVITSKEIEEMFH